MKLIFPNDCDHVPKRKLIRDLNFAFANGDKESLANIFHQDIE